MSKIQSVRFLKRAWDIADAYKWLREHNIIPMKRVDVTDNYYRFRIMPPKFKHYATKIVSNDIEIVIGYN